MKHCVWCGHIIWPWQSKSPGRILHIDCWRYVEAITSETQAQYEQRQAELRWKEEDLL